MNIFSVSLGQVPTRIFIAHLAVVVLLFIAHCIANFVVPSFENEGFNKLARVFDKTEENSIANFFSALALVVTAFAAAVIALYHRIGGSTLWISWSLAALAIAFVGFDEGAMLHDRLSYVVQEQAHTSGIFYIGWTLPYLFLVIITVLAGWPLLRALPRRTALRLTQASALFVVGALGMEMLESALLEQSLPAGVSLRDAMNTMSISPNAAALINAMEFVEETFEMLAVALALRALLLHLTEDLGFGSLVVSKTAVYGSSMDHPPAIPFAARN